MVNKPEILAIIPARGGSKGIPRKNIREFAGYPLIAYSIAAGLQAELISRVIVSTEDHEIADVARTFDAEVPFMRPVELAQDDTTDLPVFDHALRWLEKNEVYRPDLVVQLRPTSPIRPKDLVDRAIEILLHHPEADSVRGVVPAGQNPHKMWRINPEGLMRPLLKVDDMDEPYNAPRQKLPPVFWQTGHIEVIRPEVITRKNSMTGETILPAYIDPSFTVDLDDLRDWAYFERVVRERDLDMVHPGRTPRPWPEKISLVVFDFDGVMTDNRVWVDQSGVESVAAHRGDGTGIEMLLEAGVKAVGIAIMGTVKGDLHDIGKNLVIMMLEGAGFEVIDAGVDVAPEKFLELVKEHDAHIVGLSALLTTTMPSMKTAVDVMREGGVSAKIMIGGAPVTQSYCDSIGADGYSEDAAAAAISLIAHNFVPLDRR